MSLTTKRIEFMCSAPALDTDSSMITSMRARWAAEAYAQELVDDPEDGETVRVRVSGPDGAVQEFDVQATVPAPSWRASEVKS
jgi:hypothetical protein